MNGTNLTLGLVGALAAGAALSRRGSRDQDDRLAALIGIVERYRDVDLFRFREAQPFLDEVKKLGLPLLGSGGTRFVFALDDNRVAKVDYDPDASANGAELDAWSLWRRIGQEDQLVPILGHFADDRVLVMARARPLQKKHAKQMRRARQELAFPREQADHDFNWGLYEGGVRLLDYAS